MRDTWGFDGYITSDTGAIEDIYQGHNYVKTSGEAACAALRGSTDICSGAPFIDSLLAAVAAGTCSMADVTRALTRTLTAQFRLGLFDPIADQPYWHVPTDAVGTAASRNSSARAAAESMVLLKHDGAALPLAPGIRLAVIGPHALATDALVGNCEQAGGRARGRACERRPGNLTQQIDRSFARASTTPLPLPLRADLGQLCADDTSSCVQTPTAALTAANAGGSTKSVPGCAVNSSDESGFAAAVALAGASDAVVLMLGIDDSIESESHDRVSIDLPLTQHRLVAAVAAVGKPVVVVLLSGSSLDVTAEMATPGVGAIVAAGYPGIFGASAIAATLFGSNDRCCGKLAMTWYPSIYTEQIEMSRG